LQRKYPFARRKKECLAKKGSRKGRKKSLCALTTLRLCVKKKIRGGGPEMLRDKQQRREDAKEERNPFAP
jgi:hypothetical protein